MYIRQTDLFWGLSQNAVNRVMGIAQREAFAEGDVLFGSRDAARYLFILARGEVSISMGDSKTHVCTVNQIGEAFGWGSLIERQTYGCRAVCTTPGVVLKLDRDRLLKLLDSDMESGYLFFKQLSRSLGERMIKAYRRVAGDQ
ncbi:cyclic nucleotide-binding domain-containing protein [uncultured Desulfosarcina sp.]|uniref:cyclic nucleotide-binding domain-containing protein n=1 Tax=uncultured Desulfosarcina sp. TaxID=218289 RepID=UPI0029C8C25C|nr:cyclic nucleotide-binding domain-containing protein [uncultured Desulfosarcina sp.]